MAVRVFKPVPPDAVGPNVEEFLVAGAISVTQNGDLQVIEDALVRKIYASGTWVDAEVARRGPYGQVIWND